MAGTIVCNTLNTDTVGGVFTTQNAVTGIAKAWVNFTGSTGAINASFNVSSVTRGGAGNYTVNFTTAMSSANYSIVASGTRSSLTSSTVGFGPAVSQSSTSACAIYTMDSAGAASDWVNINVAIFAS